MNRPVQNNKNIYILRINIEGAQFYKQRYFMAFGFFSHERVQNKWKLFTTLVGIEDWFLFNNFTS